MVLIQCLGFCSAPPRTRCSTKENTDRTRATGLPRVVIGRVREPKKTDTTVYITSLLLLSLLL